MPGPAGGDPTDFQEIDGEVYFRVTNPNGNHELWRTDGTSEGTRLLTPLLLDPVDGSAPLSLAKFGSLLVVPAYALGYGSELAFLDLTENVLPGDYNRDELVDVQDYLFWKEHWGATLGTGLLADGNGDGVVDMADFVVWRNNLGVPAPPVSTPLADAAATSSDAALAMTPSTAESARPAPLPNPELVTSFPQLRARASSRIDAALVSPVATTVSAPLAAEASLLMLAPTHRLSTGERQDPISANDPALSAEIADRAIEELWDSDWTGNLESF